MHVRTDRSLAMTWSKMSYEILFYAINYGSKRLLKLIVGRCIEGAIHLKLKVLSSAKPLLIKSC